MNGMILHSGPMPRNLASIGDSMETTRPDDSPLVITDTIRSKLTMEPVTKMFPKGAVAAWSTTKSAIKVAVRVIQRMRDLLFMENFPFYFGFPATV